MYFGGTGASGEQQGTWCSGWGRVWDGLDLANSLCITWPGYWVTKTGFIRFWSKTRFPPF